MRTPERIQRRRTKGWRMPENAVYVGRPTRWANPFAVVWNGGRWHLTDTGDRSRSLSEEPQTFHRDDKHYARLMATRLYELHIGPMGLYEFGAEDLADLRAQLAGRDLACWCPLPNPGEPDHCHAAVLLALANDDA